ncbi:hypothetical protein BME13_17790, partial [Klebsiella pneumoniae]
SDVEHRQIKYRNNVIECDHGKLKRIRGLTLSGTKTHVKQRFLPLTPLLMVSDVLWSPVLPA